MHALILAATLAAPPCVITWADSHTLAVASYKVDAGRVAMLDMDGDTLYAREALIDLAATATTCPPPEPPAEPPAVPKAAAFAEPRTLLEASEFALTLPHAGQAGVSTATPDEQPSEPRPATDSAEPEPADETHAARRATATSEWAPRLAAMRAEYAATRNERARVAAEHDRLVDAHNSAASQSSYHRNLAEAAVARTQIAELRTRIADLGARLDQMRAEYETAREEARKSGALAVAWRDDL
jgi:hypothetical protein